MNILFLSQVLPYPLDAGPKVRSYYVLRYLAQHHNVTLAAFVRATDSPDAVAHLETFCRAVHTIPLRRSRIQDAGYLAASFLQARPFLIARDDLRAMDGAIREIIKTRTFDVIHADQLAMAHYALRVPDTRRVLDQHNAVWTLVRRLAENEETAPKRWVLLREMRLLRAYESETCAQFDRVVTVTEQDREALTFSPHPLPTPIVTIPICIDPTDIARVPFGPAARDVVCVGGMFYPPNVDGMVWFADEVLPHIWRVSPETRFYIVGARPDSKLVVLGEREPRIVVTGYVANANEYLKRAAAFVVPLRAGGGMRVKILDAWARGVPIVSTSIGAEGIRYIDGEDLYIADTAPTFAERALDLIADRAAASRMAEQGRRRVESEYAWRTVYQAWDSVYTFPGGT